MKASTISRLAILLALNQILLSMASSLPVNETLLLGAAGLITAIAVMETGFKAGAAFYLSSCLLGFFLMPNKLLLLGYGFVFGCYPLAKYRIEGFGDIKKEVLWKGLLFLFLCGAYYVGARLFFPERVLLRSLPLLLILLVINDRALSIFLSSYATHVARHRKRP